MTVLSSPWCWFGFALGAVAGTLATDLTREDFRRENFGSRWKCWRWPRKQFALVVVGAIWFIFFVGAVASEFLPWTSEWWVELQPGQWWKGLLAGSIIGAAAAPWLWLHFVRNFGSPKESGPLEQEVRIIARAHQIWLERGQPNGQAAEHYFMAKKDVEDTKYSVTEVSAQLADQELARYRLLSILFGMALLAAALWSVLPGWLGRTQQLQVFGVSLTLIAAQQGNRGTTLVGPGSPGSSRESDRLSAAMKAAYEVGAPVTALEWIGQNLENFDHLPVIDRDRSYIAWLSYELPGIKPPVTVPLKTYIDQAEAKLRSYQPSSWVELDTGLGFCDRLLANLRMLQRLCLANP